MRMHYSQQVTVLVRSLGEDGVALRRGIESLKENLTPDWARPIPERLGCYEWLVDGYWVIYEVDQSNPSETIVRLVLIETN